MINQEVLALIALLSGKLKLSEFEEKEKALHMQSHIQAIIRDIGEESSIDRKSIAASSELSVP